MSNSVYPVLPGLTHGTVRTIIPPPVEIRTTPSRREYRARNALLPRYAYKLPYEFLRSSAVAAELQTLVGFYNTHGGPFESFLFNDVDDNTVTNQVFGAGDGVSVLWQATRSFGGFAEGVDAFAANPAVYVNGALRTLGTHYSLPGAGRILFVSPPSVGASLSWTGTFYRRVRFDGDRLDTTKFMRQLFEAKTVQLLSTTT